VSAFKQEQNEGPKGHAMLKAFMRDAHVVQRAADMAVSLVGKNAGKRDRCGEFFGQCIVAAMTEGSCMGRGTSYLTCALLYTKFTNEQVTLMHLRVTICTSRRLFGEHKLTHDLLAATLPACHGARFRVNNKE
jgi:hypothetical protein